MKKSENNQPNHKQSNGKRTLSKDRVYPSDLAPAGYCCSGARVFFNAHGLSWQAFVKHGIEFNELEALATHQNKQDPIVKEVIQWVRANRK